MTPDRGMIAVSHDPSLVALSIVISIVGAYAAVDLMERVRDARGKPWLGWFLGAAVADGIGTWSMHYTAKLALRLPTLLLDWRVVVLSLLVGIAGSGAALLFVKRDDAPLWRALPAGVLLGGIGISGLHYTAMSAIAYPQLRHYHSPLLVAASIGVAIVFASLSLPLTFCFASGTTKKRRLRVLASVIVRGMANPAMHFTAMAAVGFAYAPGVPALKHAVNIGSLGIISISVVPVMVLIVAMLTSLVDRLQKQRTVSDELFEQTPEAVAVMSQDGTIIRVNREFTRLFGYTADEAIGRRPEELIGGATPLDPSPARGRTTVGGSRRHKDGTELQIDGVRVPITMPHGATETYALLRDVTEQKRAEEMLRQYPRRLIETQEAEGRRIARELHDEIGQMLTGASMLLALDSELSAHAQTRVAEARAVLHELAARVRNLALALQPSMLEDFGLVPALQSLIERYQRQTGVRVKFETDGVEVRRFSPEVEITAYRIVQEALTNVARHARVSEVVVKVTADAALLFVEIADEGSGFEEQRLPPNTVGVAGMRDRATMIGGGLTVTSAPGRGTHIIAKLPLAGTPEKRA